MKIKTVFYITRKKIWASDYANSKPHVIQVDWDGVNATGAFEQIKKNLNPKQAKILLGNDISYILALKLPNQEVNQDVVLDSIKNVIPEEINDDNFDWKRLAVEGEGQSIIQAFVVPQKMLDALSSAASESSIEIALMQPAVFVLAQIIKSDPGSLLLWSRQESLGLIEAKGAVYIAENLFQETSTAITRMTRFAYERFGLAIQGAIVDWNLPDRKPPQLAEGWRVEQRAVDVMGLFANQSIQKGEDENVLAVKPSRSQKGQSKNSAKIQTISRRQSFFLRYAILVILVIVGVLLGILAVRLSNF